MNGSVVTDRLAPVDVVGRPAERAGETVGAPRERGLAWLLSTCGLVGLLASVTLQIEKIELLKNPD